MEKHVQRYSIKLTFMILHNLYYHNRIYFVVGNIVQKRPFIRQIITELLST